MRVINKDVGGSFGLKIHTYPDEIATCALAVMLGRAVKFLADRVESFQTDIHSRDHRVTAEVAVKRDGTILGMRLDDLAPVGPFSMYPRSSVVESGQVLRTTPGPYRFRDYDARGRVVFQNKTPMSQYRAVGHPVAALVMEAMVDRVARELGLDPVEVRRRNLLTARHVSLHRAHRALLREALARGIARRGAGPGRLPGALRGARPAARAGASTAGSASACSSISPCPAPRPTAPAARASRRRTAPRSGSSRPAS